MLDRLKRHFTAYLIAAFTFVGFTQSVQAAMIGTEQVARATSVAEARAHAAAALERPELQAQLHALGISDEQAKARVAAMTDDEAAALASKIDSLPAGGDGLIGALVFIFIVLLITDILGLTKVFPFTHPIRR